MHPNEKASTATREQLRRDGAARIGVPLDRLPRHIAVIMDGNGRWARNRGLNRVEGHRAGAESARAVITECRKLGIEALTLYSFSSENWKRPQEEVGALMALAVEHLIAERSRLIENNIRLRQIGRRHPLPESVLAELDGAIEATAACDGMDLVLALNYGSRTEIVDAVREIANEVQRGEIDPADIDERMVADHLYTSGIIDPDLLIRTAGEYRLSNYLLWQLSYAEFVISAVLWPEFREAALHDAIREYADRERRFGATSEQLSEAS